MYIPYNNTMYTSLRASMLNYKKELHQVLKLQFFKFLVPFPNKNNNVLDSYPQD